MESIKYQVGDIVQGNFLALVDCLENGQWEKKPYTLDGFFKVAGIYPSGKICVESNSLYLLQKQNGVQAAMLSGVTLRDVEAKSLRPIPISTDILKDLGFEQEKFMSMFTFGGLSFWLREGILKWDSIGVPEKIRMNYVHEVQQLIRVILRKELTLLVKEQE